MVIHEVTRDLFQSPFCLTNKKEIGTVSLSLISGLFLFSASARILRHVAMSSCDYKSCMLCYTTMVSKDEHMKEKEKEARTLPE